jgi:hypothetical protein
MKNLAPIALFTYNRPKHLKKTVEALAANELAGESDLFIFSDGPKADSDKEKVEETRKFLRTISGFKSINIKENGTNSGLAPSIIAGVTELVNRFGKAIVMEDDLMSSPYFLRFMNEALDIYENEERVACIHGYLYPIKTEELPETFFIQHASSWGWATWKRAWDLFEPDGRILMEELRKKNLIRKFNINGSYNFSGMLQRQIDGLTNSWAIRWSATCLTNNKLNLYPHRSLIQNIGQDGSGEHKGNSSRHQVKLAVNAINVSKQNLEINSFATDALAAFYNSFKLTFVKKVILKIKKLW